jgi:hypothetical protein
MGNGFPKRSWPTREWAEEVWGRQHDLNLLSAYACPVQPSFWHLGHHSEKARKQKKLRSGVELTRPKIEEGRDITHKAVTSSRTLPNRRVCEEGF